MTPEERQALRKKHCPCSCCAKETERYCEYCVQELYPCDVIKVLDAFEERQALREKHHEQAGYCAYCTDGYVEYPCDVIKVLDALDEVDPIYEDDRTTEEIMLEPYIGYSLSIVPPEVLNRLTDMGFEGNGFDVVETTAILHDPKWKGKL